MERLHNTGDHAGAATRHAVLHTACRASVSFYTDPDLGSLSYFLCVRIRVPDPNI